MILKTLEMFINTDIYINQSLCIKKCFIAIVQILRKIVQLWGNKGIMAMDAASNL